MIHAEKVTTNKAAFLDKVSKISAFLGIDPNWLMHVMSIESELNPAARNSISNATGLIQFMPDTAIKLGTTIDAIKNMSNVQQLDLVLKYFLPYKGKMKSITDVYFAVFFPLAIGKPDNWTLEAKKLSASKIAQQNSGYDLNRDGRLTVQEVTEAILKKVPAQWRDLFKKKISLIPESL